MLDRDDQNITAHGGIPIQNGASACYTPGLPAPRSGILKIEAAGAGVKVTVDQVDASGTVRHWEFSANYDGNDNPVIGNNLNGDMAARTRINGTTTRTVNKKGGTITTTLTDVVSRDGKTLTVTNTGTNAQGQTVNTVGVYDKQ